MVQELLTLEKQIKENENVKLLLNNFITDVLLKKHFYNYLEFIIEINSGFLYLKAKDVLLPRTYISKNTYKFNKYLLARININELVIYKDSSNQDQFNSLIINNFNYIDILSTRKEMSKTHSETLR